MKKLITYCVVVVLQICFVFFSAIYGRVALKVCVAADNNVNVYTTYIRAYHEKKFKRLDHVL